ncbi:hypothetical protein MSEN_39700 [Mycolicibacter senuensis]|uniref:Uncharacterized protein n=1 Tax=Mycolicibacter senuensis TaxID=386913 RepID=A0A7I9XRW8_9MYCO|nr:hypothetical protein MSEN_39700 [Mycolicibacter senuensis]
MLAVSAPGRVTAVLEVPAVPVATATTALTGPQSALVGSTAVTAAPAVMVVEAGLGPVSVRMATVVLAVTVVPVAGALPAVMVPTVRRLTWMVAMVRRVVPGVTPVSAVPEVFPVMAAGPLMVLMAVPVSVVPGAAGVGALPVPMVMP